MLITLPLSMNKRVVNYASSRKNSWRYGLLETMNDPRCVKYQDDKVVAITDKYPKARYHYLVLPKIDIPSITEVTKKNETLLEHMQKIGLQLTEMHKEYSFIIGYHAVPSMYRLHLHVISTDFDSSSLKTKYHWNSFNTPNFLPSEDIIKQLKENGKLNPINLMEHEDYINSPLKCHKCDYIPKNMPDLKRHILKHAPKM